MEVTLCLSGPWVPPISAAYMILSPYNDGCCHIRHYREYGDEVPNSRQEAWEYFSTTRWINGMQPQFVRLRRPWKEVPGG